MKTATEAQATPDNRSRRLRNVLRAVGVFLLCSTTVGLIFTSAPAPGTALHPVCAPGLAPTIAGNHSICAPTSTSLEAWAFMLLGGFAVGCVLVFPPRGLR